jgi:hypothetical protein
MVRGVESEPRGRPMDVEELHRFYRTIEADHVRRLFLVGLGTGARPTAILQLDWRQMSDTAIRFNPPGRGADQKAAAHSAGMCGAVNLSHHLAHGRSGRPGD